MYIKIYSKKQLITLRSVLPLFKGRYVLPDEILETTRKLLHDKKLGKRGFVALFLSTLKNDTTEIRDTLNLYPKKLKIVEDIVSVPVKETHLKMTKNREWYMDTWKVHGEKSYIYILYAMTPKDLYGEE